MVPSLSVEDRPLNRNFVRVLPLVRLLMIVAVGGSLVSPPPPPPTSLGLLVINSRPWLSPPTVPTAAMSPRSLIDCADVIVNEAPASSCELRSVN